jgi:hypothetical protein
MGRQIAFAASATDERALLDFLRHSAQIAICQSFAPTTAQLWVESFHPDPVAHQRYLIWNTRFAWTPHYAQVSLHAQNPERAGWYFLAHTATAPLIEITRSDLPKQRYGRIYWANVPVTADGVLYDGAAFERWYTSIVGWVRRHGRKRKAGAATPYFLPDAYQSAP